MLSPAHRRPQWGKRNQESYLEKVKCELKFESEKKLEEKALLIKERWQGGKESASKAGDIGDSGSNPGSGRSPGGGNGNPLQYSCLENPMDRGTWWATVHGITKSQTWLSGSHFHFRFFQGTFEGEREVRWDGEKAKKGIMVRQVTALESWSLIPLGSSGSQSKIHTSEIAHPKGKRVGIPIRQFPLDIGWGLYPEGVNSPACLAYCMWVDRRDSPSASVAREIHKRSAMRTVESQAVLHISAKVMRAGL